MTERERIRRETIDYPLRILKYTKEKRMLKNNVTPQRKRLEFEKYKLRKQKNLLQDTYIPMKVRKAIRPLLRGMLRVNRKLQGYQIEFVSQTQISSEKPVIFAVSHIGKLDFEIVSEII